jgi:teichuronic acid biosynthesis glycosyltransferase TuaG|tara:strand:+ start:4454 stop:4627 length:174 start_codon:yes stop_codon:yes gene_type:complete
MKVVDIILPNYNSIHNVSATINSILKQTYKNWRLIIIDDASNQTTKNILDKFKKKKK